MCAQVGAVVAGLCCSVFSARAAEQQERPSVSLSLQKFDASGGDEFGVVMEWNVPGMAPWRVVRCDWREALVTMEDSEGNKASSSHSSSWSGTSNWFTDRRNGSEGILQFQKWWKPSAGARWVRVKGGMPMVLSRESAVAEPVVLKLAIGASVPVILKEAALNEHGRQNDGDVKGTLTVQDYVVGKDGARLKLMLNTEQDMGFMDLEVHTEGGTFLDKENEMETPTFSLGDRKWTRVFDMGDAGVGEVKVVVKYATHLQRVVVPLDTLVGLAGFSSGIMEKQAVPANREAVVQASPVAVPGAVAGGKPQEKCPVAVKFSRLSMERERSVRKGEPEAAVRMNMPVWLTVKTPRNFALAHGLAEQRLEMTDSTGRKLAPAVFRLGESPSCIRKEKDGMGIELRGAGEGLASSGAAWVRLTGRFLIPVATGRESGFHDVPLVVGTSIPLTLPVEHGGGVAAGGDVAVAGDSVAGELLVKQSGLLNQGKDHVVTLALSVEGSSSGVDKILSADGGGGVGGGENSFDFDGFLFFDEQGVPLNVTDLGVDRKLLLDRNLRGPNAVRTVWSHVVLLPGAGDRKKIKVRMKYRAGAEVVSVPVDVTLGLRGVMPRKP